jgi:hypothetical protein
MIDICTVVFREELAILKAQAQSVALRCQDLGSLNIYVVVNDTDDVVAEIDSAWWGNLAPKVMVIPRSTFSTTYVDNGWLSQQVLKLLTPALSYNKYTMVLDAKTVFVKDFKLNELLQNNRPQVGITPIYPVFETSSQITGELFGIDVKRQLGPGGVPFFFHNATVRAMIAKVEELTQQSFPEWFQAQGMLTEFILYSGYIDSVGKWDELYSTRVWVNPCNVCHSEVDAWERKFAEMQNALTVSVHRHAWTKLTPAQQQQYQHFLIDRGILIACQI